MNPVDVLIAHPLKHHVFPLAAGIKRGGASMRLVTPFYRKGLGRIVAALPGSTGRKAAGYHYDGLDAADVVSPPQWQLRKLRRVSNTDVLVRDFDTFVAAMISRGELRARVLVTMQDYLPRSVAAGKAAGMLIWSDQILNSSRSAATRINTHYRKAGVTPPVAHDESANDAILSIADIVTAPSRYTLSDIADRVRASASLHMVPYGVDKRRFDINRKKSRDTVRLVARANSIRKGGHLLMDALIGCGEELCKLARGKSIEVIIVGTMEPALGERLQSARFPDGIRVSSTVVPHLSMPELLASANLFVMPSLSEGMSLICIEAMQAGLPLVITPYCGVDSFEHMRMGVETTDSSDALAEALLLAFHHSDQWPEWGRHATNTANMLDWGSYEDSVAATVSSLLA